MSIDMVMLPVASGPGPKPLRAVLGVLCFGRTDDDGIHDVGGAGGCAGHAGGAAGSLVAGEDVAAFEHPGDLVLSVRGLSDSAVFSNMEPGTLPSEKCHSSGTQGVGRPSARCLRVQVLFVERGLRALARVGMALAADQHPLHLLSHPDRRDLRTPGGRRLVCLRPDGPGHSPSGREGCGQPA